MRIPFHTIRIGHDRDVVDARRRARQVAEHLGFDAGDQTRIATAASETARIVLVHSGGGCVEFALTRQGPAQTLLITVMGEVGSGALSAPEGGEAPEIASGLTAAQRLMDHFELRYLARGEVSVVLGKVLPSRVSEVGSETLAHLAAGLQRGAPEDLLGEVQRQNQELLSALQELRSRQAELLQLNRELEDTNRGVVALYAELDEKAEHLRQADALKSRFLSNMSHEFRTPLVSILGLSQLLLDREDGDLTEEQERQVTFIRSAARELSELVDDLLDLAKIEAGRIVVRPTEFRMEDAFSALRGMLRPLLMTSSVDLVFEEPVGIPPLHTDKGKVSQVLRNLLSNALKFTERGEVRVSARLLPGGGAVAVSVADTGIGIAPEDQPVIFEEFTQLDSPLQRRVKGTGLGLPLSRRLCELLGGSLTVDSRQGAGSTFTATFAIRYADEVEEASPDASVAGLDPGRLPVLVLEDSAESILLYEKLLKGTEFQVVPAGTTRMARGILQRLRPAAVILDILLVGEEAWDLLEELKREEATASVPVIVVSTVEEPHKAYALGASDYARKPISRGWLVERLRALALGCGASSSAGS